MKWELATKVEVAERNQWEARRNPQE